MTPPRILLVDDEPSMLRCLSRILAHQGYQTETAEDGLEAMEKLEQVYDLVLTDIRMPGADGFQVLEHIQTRSAATPVVMLTAHGSIPDAVQAMRMGAFDFLTKPLADNQLLIEVVERALTGRAITNGPIEGVELPTPTHNGVEDLGRWRAQYAYEVVGQSRSLLDALTIAAQAADCDCPVLITGESGTGKELLARALHRSSSRARAPFVAVNCPAIPKELVESELFGHTKGAFTGATMARMGRFAAADKGTLFLDEIGEMEFSIQSKLLRVLQDYQVTRVGESRSQKVDVRVITATNRDLEQLASENLFREDLYYRLNVIQIHLPPLRDRPEDVDLLVDHFIDSISHDRNMPAPTLTPVVRAALRSCRWPGNIRQLRNVLERLVILRRGGTVELSHLPLSITRDTDMGSAREGDMPALGGINLPLDGIDLKEMLQQVEDNMIRQALTATGGNKNQAAKILGLNRTTLVEKLRKRAV